MIRYPQISSVLADNSRKVNFCVYRSLFSILSLFFWCAFWVLVIYGLERQFGNIHLPDIPFFRHVSLRWLALIPSLLMLEILRRRYDNIWIFEPKQLRHKGGLLSFRYIQPVIRYRDVRAITVDQGLIGRVFNFGDVTVETAGSDTSELVIKGARAPHELAFVIDRLRKEFQGDIRVED